MQTLVDTSVWIDFFRGLQTPQVMFLESLLGHHEIIIGDLILAEVLQGARESELSEIEAAFSSVRVVSLVGGRLARLNAAHCRRLRSQGVTVRKTIDALIAGWCIDSGVPLLHADKDFHWFAPLGLIEAWQDASSP